MPDVLANICHVAGVMLAMLIMACPETGMRDLLPSPEEWPLILKAVSLLMFTVVFLFTR